MSHKHHPQISRSRARKRAQFAKQSQQKISTTGIVVVVLTVVLGVGLYLALGGFNDKPASTTVVSTNAEANTGGASRSQDARARGDILIPASDVSSGKAKFFDYTAADNTSVRFFVIKSSDGVYRAALDACDVCYAAKKGYYQEGDDMVCRNCGRKFPSALVNEVSGGCNPVPVPRAVDGDRVVIKANDLEHRRFYF